VVLLLTSAGFGQSDSGQPAAAAVPSVYDHGFRISYPDRAIGIGGATIRARAAEDARAAGLYLLLLNEAGQPDSTVYTKDFNELLRAFPDRMVIGISVQDPDSEYPDQFFFGLLKADLSGLAEWMGANP
jgi:hypothetical protein